MSALIRKFRSRISLKNRNLISSNRSVGDGLLNWIYKSINGVETIQEKPKFLIKYGCEIVQTTTT